MLDAQNWVRATAMRPAGAPISLAAMSKRLERWKDPETVRLGVGWLAGAMGGSGFTKVLDGLFLFVGEEHVGFAGVPVPGAVAILA